MKALLLRLPTGPNLPDVQLTESLGIASIASVLRRDGLEVEMLDADFLSLSPKDVVRETLAREFDVLGITAMHQHSEAFFTVTRAIRKKRKNAIIIAGGYLPSLATEQVLKALPELDFVVKGEGEIAAAEVFGKIARNEDWHRCQGVAYLDGGVVKQNLLPQLVQDLDALPFPARDPLMQAPPHVAALVSASRGCYNRCAFCCINSFYSLYGTHTPRFRSAQSVVDEIESVVAATGRTKFAFVDDDFIGPGTKSQQRVISLADEIIARKLKINFSIEVRTDEVTEDTLKRLKEAGLDYLFLGLESGVQNQLDRFNKNVTVEQNRRGLEIVRNSGIEMAVGFVMFDPYTTVEELEENTEFLKETDLAGKVPPTAQIMLFHGIPMLEKVRADGLLREEGLKLDYVFQDPQVRMMWKVTKASKFISRIKRKIMPGKKSC